MKRTFIDVLVELPVDATLRDFLTNCALPLPADIEWEDAPKTSHAIVQAIRDCADPGVRSLLIARLMAIEPLADATGKQALFQIAARHPQILGGLLQCKSDLHRAFWLSVHHPDAFEQACDVDYLERHSTQAQQHDLGIRRLPETSDDALAAVRRAISDFYQRELQCGDGSIAYLIERSPGVFMLTVHVKDLAMLRLEFEGEQLTRRLGHPNIHMVLEYSVATGVVRTLVRGGGKYHQMLVDAFAEHLLGAKVDAQRIKPPTLDLSVLRFGFDVPQAVTDGFNALQVKSLTLLCPDGMLKLECTAMASSDQRCVTDLLQEKVPGPLAEHWLVIGAHINLYYPPAAGKTRAKVVTIEVTRKGRLNLHKFDAALQAQLEGYLVSLGILQPGQTLSAQQTPPATGVADREPAYEG